MCEKGGRKVGETSHLSPTLQPPFSDLPATFFLVLCCLPVVQMPSMSCIDALYIC